LNEACWKELCEKINGIQPVHVRANDDPEWTKPKITTIREITANLAYWAVRQLGSSSSWPTDDAPAYPPNIEKVIGYLHAALKKTGKFDQYFAELSLCDISELLYDILYDQNISVFDEWNREDKMGKYWLYLDALLTNVCVSIRDERRILEANFEGIEMKQELF
jgi:hypothetical protein